MAELRHGQYYICKRFRLLEYLKTKGFLPIQTLPDLNNPKYNVWKFENSIELEDTIRDYFLKVSIKHLSPKDN